MKKQLYFKRVRVDLSILLIILISLSGCTEHDVQLDESVEELTFYNADTQISDPWTDPIAKKITEKTKVKLVSEHPLDDNDNTNQIDLMVANKKYPDLIYAKDNAQVLVAADALIDMSELIDKYGPNIKKLYGKQYNRLRYSKRNSSIYQLCSKGIDNNIYETTGNAMLQLSVLKDKNYAIPKTIKEYETYIKEYMKKNPKIDGKDTIGITLCCSDWRWLITLANPAGFIADGSPDNGQWIVKNDNNYECMYKHTSQKQKEYFRWLNRMYNEGVLDKDFATQTYNDYLSKISSGRVLGLMDQDYDIVSPLAILNKEQKYERTYAPLPITYDSSVQCSTLMDQGLPVGWGVGISKSCKNPEKVIKFLDYLCSDEGQVLIHWGIEGQNYTIEDGYRVMKEEQVKMSIEDKDYKQKTGVGFHTYPFPCYGDGVKDSKGDTYTNVSKKSVMNKYNPAQKECLKAWDKELFTDIFPQPKEFDKVPYAPLWSQMFPSEINKAEANIDEVAHHGLIECIVCAQKEFDTKWSKLQKDIKDAGVEKVSNSITEFVRDNVDFTNSVMK